MRILFDNQIFSDQPYGGVSRYFHELIAELAKIGSAAVSVEVPAIHSEGERESLKHDALSRFFLYKAVRKAKKWLQSRLDRRASVKLLEKQSFDIFHPTYYDPYFLQHLKGKPFVLTIYDMIHEKLPEYFGPQNQTRSRKALLAEKASKIIAISERTKADIIEVLGIAPEKIEVVHLATKPEKPEPIKVPSSYILFVGERGRYKDFRTLTQAFAALATKHPDLMLVCAGRNFTKDEAAELQTLGISSRCIRVKADSAQLAFLYSRAIAFVFPSEYEGFGLPILEAFSYSCPVILSRASCFPEIAGDAAVYFETKDPTALGHAIEGILNSPDQRAELIRKGSERLKQFSWDATAQQTLALYERAWITSRPSVE